MRQRKRLSHFYYRKSSSSIVSRVTHTVICDAITAAGQMIALVCCMLITSLLDVMCILSEKFDHYCPWISNVVGLRNYRFFWNFLFFITISALLILSGSIYHLAHLAHAEGNEIPDISSHVSHFVFGTGRIRDALHQTPSLAIVIFLSFLSFWAVISLFVFHGASYPFLSFLSSWQWSSQNTWFPRAFRPTNPSKEHIILLLLSVMASSGTISVRTVGLSNFFLTAINCRSSPGTKTSVAHEASCACHRLWAVALEAT